MMNLFSQPNTQKKFKRSASLEVRKQECNRIMNKYPDRRPIICEKLTANEPVLPKNKFLVPHDLTLGQFIYVLRKNLKLDPAQALFIFINEKIATNSSLIGSLYDENKDEDGFLYIVYSLENTFG
jgi:GABA(A) receptor-associated protein